MLEAKDSKWCPQHGYPLPCDKCGLGQYEAGKQTGRNESVEWFLKHKIEGQGYDWGIRKGAPVEIFTVDPLELLVMLKKWGIDVRKTQV